MQTAGGGKRVIYITGDCHGDYRRFGNSCFPEQNEMTKDDYVIKLCDYTLRADRDPESADGGNLAQ